MCWGSINGLVRTLAALSGKQDLSVAESPGQAVRRAEQASADRGNLNPNPWHTDENRGLPAGSHRSPAVLRDGKALQL